MVGAKVAALVCKAEESGKVLNLGKEELGMLSGEAWKQLGAAIEQNGTIEQLLLHGNKLGKLKEGGWRWLAQALKKSPSIDKVLLMTNDLSSLKSVRSWEMLADAFWSNENIDDLVRQATSE